MACSEANTVRGLYDAVRSLLNSALFPRGLLASLLPAGTETVKV